MPESATNFFDTLNGIIEWCRALPTEIAEMSVNLMSMLYELCATLILKTPLWIFDNEWFSNTTYLFSLISLGIVSVLTIIEGIKRMTAQLKGKRTSSVMDLKDIARRWFIVAGATTAIPWLFQKFFQVLNYISDFLISMGGDTMTAVSGFENLQLFDVLILIAFDAVLISSIVPILWQNGRRFFDIMVLGVTTPLALTAWIFDDYRHLFKQWWNNLKQQSLVQVYYSLFLLVLGWFMFGVPTPTYFTGMLVKLLIVIGGFSRMVNPPRLISGKLDTGGGLTDTLNGGKSINKVKKNFMDSANMILQPTNIVRKAMGKDAWSLKKAVTGKKK